VLLSIYLLLFHHSPPSYRSQGIERAHLLNSVSGDASAFAFRHLREHSVEESPQH
jgi:hypothetical protein